MTMQDTEAGVPVRIEYYALFKACAGKPAEEAEAAGGDPARLYDALRRRYKFPLHRSLVHLAVNDAWASWESPLRAGDRIVFIPPVSGG
jgi:molybdopterin converting factor small subunit